MKYFARAPGKMIITGEHFVVHGSFALAAAIDKGALVKAEAFEDIEVKSKELGLVASDIKVPHPLKPTIEAIKATLEFIGEKRGVKVEINSDIPASSGLGSSSAVAVATVAATSSALGHDLSPEEIVHLATISERITHGKPSGIDVNVSVYGGVILFKIGEKVKLIKLDRDIEFLVGYSGIERQTSKMVAKFSEMKRMYPNFFASLVSSSSCLTEIATDALTKNDLTTLGSIMSLFHVVLNQMGVSREELDYMVEKALEVGCIGAKLTGAGGGGCIIALPKSGEARIVAEHLKKKGMNISIAKIPCMGVKVWKEER
ncbi:MAG: mevalonate kinase [Candidatus Methylarchaceae archaeon HK02M1]|nr:mevalonate kinase [Candidatus Methylarchaceae archaeon HK02M1]